jgi:SAM-dependent methyltransferase
MSSENHDSNLALLLASAPIARAAAALCHADPADGHTCAWYHGPWPVFRALGLVSTAAVHEDMMRSALAAIAADGQHNDVLISGCTDFAMLALVRAAWADRPFHATVVDRCATPLRLCAWYAQRHGLDIDTHAGNILDYPREGCFDVICTHAFMGYFDDGARAQLVRRWHALLRPGGRLVTVQRVREHHPPGLVRFTTEQARQFRQDAAAQAQRFPERLGGMSARELADCAIAFTEHFTSHPIRSREAFARLFTESGFRLERLAYDNAAAGGSNTANPGPSVPGSAEYAHVIAVRD